MIQLWVNLPREHKMTKPKYQSISKESIGVYKLDNDEVKINEDDIYKENDFILFNNIDGSIILESISEIL